jgi:hypothetical protein
VKGVRIARDTLVVSVAFGLIALVAGFVLGQRPIGLGMALGLVLGAGNGQLIQQAIARRVPFVVSSIVRMAALSAIAILIAFLVGASPAAVLLGIGVAQVVMVGAALRQGLKA